MNKMLLATLLVAFGAMSAEARESTCATEAKVRAVAKEAEAKEIIPLRGDHGRPYLLMILKSGDGLVFAKSDEGCFDTAMPLPVEGIEIVLKRTPAV